MAALSRTKSKLAVEPGAGLGLQRSMSHEQVAGGAMDMDLPVVTQSLLGGQASVKGARSRNEDCHGLREMNRYAYVYVCDGHGGPNLAKKMGEVFDQVMQTSLATLAADANPKDLVNFLRVCYWEAVKVAEAERGGTTFTAGILQLDTMIFASLQLGDSLVGALDPIAGGLIDAKHLFYLDDAEGRDAVDGAKTITRTHSFTDPTEVQRYRSILKDHGGLGLRVDKRTDCHPLEDRCLADVTGMANVGLPEPSRTVQCAQSYADGIFHQLQRSPEFVVWQLPDDRPVCIFAVCDGFESKLAMPTVEKMAQCLSDPDAYLQADNFEGTVFEACNVVSVDAHWKSLTIKEKLIQIRDRTTLPDREWQEAHETSCNAIVKILDDNGGKIPRLVENPQAAVEAAVNTAVVLLSDDNVTAEVLVIQPN